MWLFSNQAERDILDADNDLGTRDFKSLPQE